MKKNSLELYKALKRFAKSRKGNIFIAFWAFSEAWIWFIFPDFILLIFGILSPQKLWKYLTISLIASALGGLLMIYLCADHVNFVEKYLFHLPFTNLGMLNHLKTSENNFGNLSYLLQAFSGIPFKVWTYQAVSQNWNIPIYFVFALFGRALRMIIILFLGKFLQNNFGRFLKENYLTFLLIFSFAFFAFMQISNSHFQH